MLLLEGFLTLSQKASIQEAIKIINKEAKALAVVRSKPIIDLQRTAERAIQSI